MGEMREVLESIQDHTSVEIKERYRNPSIGMGEVLIGHSKSKIWIVNNDFTRTTIIQRDITGGFQGTTSTGVKGEYSESGSVAIPKNREPAITLLQEYEGPFEKVFINGQRKSFVIRNSAHYRNTGSDIRDVVVGVAGQKNWSTFPLLKDALASLDRLEGEIVRKREAEEAAKRKAEELRRKQAEEAERLAREEAKRLEEEARRAEEEASKRPVCLRVPLAGPAPSIEIIPSITEYSGACTLYMERISFAKFSGLLAYRCIGLLFSPGIVPNIFFTAPVVYIS